MNTQSMLWFVHSMHSLFWNGEHRRNMSPTWTPGTPEPVMRPPACQEPVRSGFPLGSLGVGAFGSGAAPPPRPPPGPPGPCAARDTPMTKRAATVHARSRAPICRNAWAAFPGAIRCLFIAESSLSSLLDAVRNRHDHVDLADLRYLCRHGANGRAVLAFDGRAWD